MRLFILIVAVTIFAAAAAAADVDVIRLEAPDFKSTSVSKTPAKPPVTLRLVTSTANEITDTEKWFEKNGLVLNKQREVPEGMPAEVEGAGFIEAIRSGGRWLGIYGPDFSGGRIVVGMSDEGDIEYAFDFSEYRLAPRNVQTDIDYVDQRVLWAEHLGDVLYVAHGHRTYAASSYGMNAYLSAIDVRGGKALWHSAPLVSNAANFTFLGDSHLVTGYGFTAEPDFVYVLRAKDGAVMARIPVKSGPEYILPYRDRVYVRTYNRDYVFSVDGKP